MCRQKKQAKKGISTTLVTMEMPPAGQMTSCFVPHSSTSLPSAPSRLCLAVPAKVWAVTIQGLGSWFQLWPPKCSGEEITVYSRNQSLFYWVLLCEDMSEGNMWEDTEIKGPPAPRSRHTMMTLWGRSGQGSMGCPEKVSGASGRQERLSSVRRGQRQLYGSEDIWTGIEG